MPCDLNCQNCPLPNEHTACLPEDLARKLIEQTRITQIEEANASLQRFFELEDLEAYP